MPIFKFLSKKPPAAEDVRKACKQEVEEFLWSCERMFFDNERYLLTNVQKIHLVHMLADMCREAETNPDQLCIYDFFHSLYRFPRHEYENYLKNTDVPAILRSMASLQTPAKNALVLVLHGMLYATDAPSAKNISIVNELMAAMDMDKAAASAVIAGHSFPFRVAN